MDTQFYEKSAAFLEGLIKEHPDNTEIIKAYIKLIEKKAEVEIQFLKGDESIIKEREKLYTDRYKADAEVDKKSIDKNGDRLLSKRW
ncbi:hypothetical protein F0231_20780 [Vibrio sp. RE86]|uniref:hypothetical protein n=1 Tax=Vibrio sp. RE86 TaxID=2607605 RepID=UPI0014934DCD|nr:hypothetical protein [Vibrio sp. RE86]NOH82147.1 hypothetical protein [Vibrio sp. RE86]